MRIVQRAVRGDAHISQNLYALMIGVPIGNGPGRFTHFRQMIKNPQTFCCTLTGMKCTCRSMMPGVPRHFRYPGTASSVSGGVINGNSSTQKYVTAPIILVTAYTVLCSGAHQLQFCPIRALRAVGLAVIAIAIAIPTPTRPISSPAPCEYIILLTVCATVLSW